MSIDQLKALSTNNPFEKSRKEFADKLMPFAFALLNLASAGNPKIKSPLIQTIEKKLAARIVEEITNSGEQSPFININNGAEIYPKINGANIATSPSFSQLLSETLREDGQEQCEKRIDRLCAQLPSLCLTVSFDGNIASVNIRNPLGKIIYSGRLFVSPVANLLPKQAESNNF